MKQSTRKLCERIVGHRSDIRTAKRPCALSEHVIHLGHMSDSNHASILDIERNWFKRNVILKFT